MEEVLATAESSEEVPEREADDNPEEAEPEVKAEGSEPTEETGAAEDSPGVTEEAAESAQGPEAVETQVHATAAAPKKGLMQRRKSFLQTSVPNAHRGNNPKIPRIMLGIVVIFIIVSFILAAVTS